MARPEKGRKNKNGGREPILEYLDVKNGPYYMKRPLPTHIKAFRKTVVSKTEEDAGLMQRSLQDNAHQRNTYFNIELDALSDADKASDQEVLDKTREIAKGTFSGRGGRELAINIANGIRLHHII